MNSKVKLAALVVGLCCVALVVLEGLKNIGQNGENKERVWHHQQAMAAGVDTQVGTTSVPQDGMVDESFTSHLPLVIIDTMGQEIVNTKYYDLENQAYRYTEGVDPYTDMVISIIDHNNERPNTLGDTPTQSSYGRIKVRGNTSASAAFPKLQYLLKLKTEDGEKNPVEILGMEPSDTWILNGTMIDKSYMRNYLALNFAGELDPYTPDIRMCEVVLKRENGYEYIGLYGMYEKIEQGEGRVDIPAVSNPIALSDQSYIVQRDRKAVDGYSMEVWSTQHQRSENWINLEYPNPENITPEYWNYIQNDIRQIEQALYSDDKNEFIRYRTLLDVDSFVDYFIINEFFGNYDAGWNSTFLYKNEKGQVAIGPVWDFDMAMDNYDKGLFESREIVFYQAPWFDRLVTDDYFVAQVIQRYQQLRRGTMSDKNIQETVKGLSAFLEYPAKRDRSRWNDANPFELEIYEENGSEIQIVRDKATWEEEVQRVEDTLLLHGEYLDTNLPNALAVSVETVVIPFSVGGWLLIIAFFVSIILVQRYRKGI